MESRAEQIKEFLNDEKKFKALVNDEEFIGKVSGGTATTETYKEELKKFGLEISEDEAKQIENTVNKIFETPDEKIKLDDDFLKDIAGGNGNDNTQSDIINNNLVSVGKNNSSGSGSSLALGLEIGIPVAAWLGSGIGCAIAASVYKKKKNKDKFHKCATAAFHILNAPVLPVEVGLGTVVLFSMGSTGGLNGKDKDIGESIENFFMRPVESIFGVDVE